MVSITGEHSECIAGLGGSIGAPRDRVGFCVGREHWQAGNSPPILSPGQCSAIAPWRFSAPSGCFKLCTRPESADLRSQRWRSERTGGQTLCAAVSQEKVRRPRGWLEQNQGRKTQRQGVGVGSQARGGARGTEQDSRETEKQTKRRERDRQNSKILKSRKILGNCWNVLERGK